MQPKLALLCLILATAKLTTAVEYLVYKRTGDSSSSYSCSSSNVQALIPVGPADTAQCLTRGAITNTEDTNGILIDAGKGWTVDCNNAHVRVYNTTDCTGGYTTRDFTCDSGISYSCANLAYDVKNLYTTDNCATATPQDNYLIAYDFCQLALGTYTKSIRDISLGVIATYTYTTSTCTGDNDLTDALSFGTGYYDCLGMTDVLQNTLGYKITPGGYVTVTNSPTLQPSVSPTATSLAPTTTKAPTFPRTDCRVCSASGDPHYEIKHCAGALAGSSVTFDCMKDGTQMLARGATWKIFVIHTPWPGATGISYIGGYRIDYWDTKTRQWVSTYTGTALQTNCGYSSSAPWKATCSCDFCFGGGAYKQTVTVEHTEFSFSAVTTFVGDCQQLNQDGGCDSFPAWAVSLSSNYMTPDVGVCQNQTQCLGRVGSYVIQPATSRRVRRDLADFRSINVTETAGRQKVYSVREHQSCLRSNLTGNYMDWCHFDVTVTNEEKFILLHQWLSEAVAQQDANARNWFQSDSPPRTFASAQSMGVTTNMITFVYAILIMAVMAVM